MRARDVSVAAAATLALHGLRRAAAGGANLAAFVIAPQTACAALASLRPKCAALESLIGTIVLIRAAAGVTGTLTASATSGQRLP